MCYLSFFFAVPPSEPVIYDPVRGVRTNNVEAYTEDSDVMLDCEVGGGKSFALFQLNFKYESFIRVWYFYSRLVPEIQQKTAWDTCQFRRSFFCN